ncbi:hypothetical protein [Methylobacterium sp. A54F]
MVSTNRVQPSPSPGAPTLYCEFTNFADQTPLVGFYFRIEGSPMASVYALLLQREWEGSQARAFSTICESLWQGER